MTDNPIWVAQIQGRNHREIPVLYLDNHVLVVLKPAGLLAQADSSADIDLLTVGKAFIKDRFNKPGRVFLALVHRLDRPVSGVMVLARTSKAAARLSERFRDRDVVKRYCAIVDGRMLGSGELKGFIKKRGRGPELVSGSTPGAADARLEWRAVAEFGGHTLVDILLVTGRPHQIRLQLADAGHPVSGDRRYGSKTKWPGPGIALHCYALGVEHPTRSESFCWTAAPAGWPDQWGPHISDLTKASAG